MTYEIYLLEDEENLNQVLQSYLEAEGWRITSYLTGKDALKAADQKPHLWILDIMLPDENADGFLVLREIRRHYPKMPIIFISARDADLDRIIGLEVGSDDYLAKPFLPRELVVRCKKLLQRIYERDQTGAVNLEHKRVQAGEYTVNKTMRTVHRNGEHIDLTAKEFDLLLLLAENPGQAFSRDQLIARIWGEDYFGSDRVVDDLVRRLRKKLPDLRVETLYGYGYRMTGL